jgi:hypothetical protein
MLRSTRTLVARAVILGVTASVCVVAGPAVVVNAAVTSDQPATPTAVAVFTVDPSADAPALAADVQFALDTAVARAEEKPADFAPPYVDPATNKLYAPTIHETSADAEAPITVDYATLPDEGTDIADEPEEAPPPGEEAPAPEPARFAAAATLPTTGTKTFYPIVRQSKYSQESLEATSDEAITADVPGKESIVATYVDGERNRVVVEANAVTEDMRTALAGMYGADKVAIHLNPRAQRPEEASRDHDSNPYKGGSAIDICTNGFAWNNGSTLYMLTAGHCINPGGGWYLPDGASGGARIGTGTKWDTYGANGSIKLSGQKTYAGDVALIDMYGANKSIGKIYTGGKKSNTTRDVASSGLAYRGHKYCTGGRNKGVLCNWRVTNVAKNVTYKNGNVGRNLFWATKQGWCLYGGDSGGPVYTTNKNGKIIAKGIISGAGGGGSDHYAGKLDGDDCRGYFSEVKRAEKAFPGAISKRP